jgi:hypothetical protein
MISVEEFYKDLGNLTQQEKDDVLRGLLLAMALSPIGGEANFRELWADWRDKVDYYLSFTTFGRIIQMLIELKRLRYIKKCLEELKSDLLSGEQPYLLIGEKKYPADFLISALSLLDSEIPDV